MLAPQLRADPADLRLRRLERGTRTEPGQHPRASGRPALEDGARRVLLDWKPEFRDVGVDGPDEPGRHHADDREQLIGLVTMRSARADGTSDDLRAPTEPAHPQTMAEDDGAVGARGILLRRERPAQRGCDADEAQVAGRDRLSPHAFGAVAGVQRESRARG